MDETYSIVQIMLAIVDCEIIPVHCLLSIIFVLHIPILLLLLLLLLLLSLLDKKKATIKHNNAYASE